MNRQEALVLAEEKASDWNLPYRVLRCTDKYETQTYTIEQSGSYDSPRGWVLVEVFTPKKP